MKFTFNKLRLSEMRLDVIIPVWIDGVDSLSVFIVCFIADVDFSRKSRLKTRHSGIVLGVKFFPTVQINPRLGITATISIQHFNELIHKERAVSRRKRRGRLGTIRSLPTSKSKRNLAHVGRYITCIGEANEDTVNSEKYSVNYCGYKMLQIKSHRCFSRVRI